MAGTETTIRFILIDGTGEAKPVASAATSSQQSAAPPEPVSSAASSSTEAVEPPEPPQPSPSPSSSAGGPGGPAKPPPGQSASGQSAPQPQPQPSPQPPPPTPPQPQANAAQGVQSFLNSATKFVQGGVTSLLSNASLAIPVWGIAVKAGVDLIGAASSKLSGMFNDLSTSISGFSKDLSVANARNELKDVQQNIELGRSELGGTIADFNEAVGDLGRDLKETFADVVGVVLPEITAAVEGLDALVHATNSAVQMAVHAERVFTQFFDPDWYVHLMAKLSGIEDGVKDEGDDDQDDPTERMVKWFADQEIKIPQAWINLDAPDEIATSYERGPNIPPGLRIPRT